MYHQYQQSTLKQQTTVLVGCDYADLLDTPSTSRASDMLIQPPPSLRGSPTPIPRSPTSSCRIPAVSASTTPSLAEKAEPQQNQENAPKELSTPGEMSPDSLASSDTLPPAWPAEPETPAACPHRPHASPSNTGGESSMTLDFEEDEEGEQYNIEAGGSEQAEDAAFELGPMQQARAHWIQLHKVDMQLPVLRRMFLGLLQRHAPLRTLWPFARCADARADGQGVKEAEASMVSGASLRHFCAAYQGTLTMVMDNLDEEPALSRLLQDLGSNHFFYDATEAQFKLIRLEFKQALRECLAGTQEEMDEELEMDWDTLWAKLESNMAFGLALQRHNYLAHCVTGAEMHAVRDQWACMRAARDPHARKARIVEAGMESFNNGLECIIGSGKVKETLGQLFEQAVHDLLWTMDQAIVLWEPGTGFLRLCAEINGKCGGACTLIRQVSAALVRNAYMQGFSGELEPDVVMDATVMHTWTKIYRVAEQAIIADGIANNR